MFLLVYMITADYLDQLCSANQKEEPPEIQEAEAQTNRRILFYYYPGFEMSENHHRAVLLLFIYLFLSAIYRNPVSHSGKLR